MKGRKRRHLEVFDGGISDKINTMISTDSIPGQGEQTQGKEDPVEKLWIVEEV